MPQMTRTSEIGTLTARRVRRPRNTLRAIPALAAWRLKPMWRLLALMQLGLVAAVALVCTVPLVSEVATLANLRDTLERDPNLHTLHGQITTNQPSIQLLRESEQRLSSFIATNLQPFGVGSPDFTMISQPLSFRSPQGALASDAIDIVAYTPDGLNRRLRIIQGRLPSSSPAAPAPTTGPAVFEIAITQPTAEGLHLQLGSSVALGGVSVAAGRSVSLRVVGIIDEMIAGSVSDPRPSAQGSNGSGATGTGSGTTYEAVASSVALLADAVHWDTIARIPPQDSGIWTLGWTYPMALSHLDELDLRRLSDYQRLNFAGFLAMSDIPNATQGDIRTGTFDALYNYQQDVRGAELAVTLLLLQILGLVFLFVANLAGMLIERQEALVATLRSRGASRGQVLGTFLAQSVVLGLIALTVGPLVAVLLARVSAPVLLPPGDRDSAHLLTGDTLSIALSTAIYAGAAAAIAIGVMIWATWRASALNVLALRREATRATEESLWRRLHLDVFAALLAFGVYGTLSLITQLQGPALSLSQAELRFGLAPLAILAPVLLIVSGAALFLRALPLLLQLGERLAARGQAASFMLAVTLLARAPRRAARTIFLLALATCFATFTLSAIVTLQQHVLDVAAYQVGADFSGALQAAPQVDQQDIATASDQFAQVPGVTSAALGYRTDVPIARASSAPASPFGGDSTIIQIAAVDSERFARTAIWTQQNSTRALPDLTASLLSQRAEAATRHTVAALVDSAAWNQLRLSPGATFRLATPRSGASQMQFVAIAEIAHIPTIQDSQGAGILVDYTSYVTVYRYVTGDSSNHVVAPNFAWLRTRDDAASLASVRAALASGPYALTALESPDGPHVPPSDRRALVAAGESDVFQVNLSGTLAIATITALVLALCGTLLAAWLHLRGQLLSFALLRALGMGPRSIRNLVLWEQGITFVVALALGLVLGVFLAATVPPSLANLRFSGSFGGPITDAGPAVQIVWPFPVLALIVGGLAITCATAAALASVGITRASLGAALRLNED